MRGLNAVNYAELRPSWLQDTLASLALTCVLGGLALVAIAFVVVAPIVMTNFPLGPGLTIAADTVRWLITSFVTLLALCVIYRYGPNLPDRKPEWITPGAILAAVLLLLMSVGFSLYLAQFGNYNKVYGSIGAAVGLLVWFYISAYVVLLGGTLNAELDRRRLLGPRPAVSGNAGVALDGCPEPRAPPVSRSTFGTFAAPCG